jgi:hypothetical protein
MKVTILGRVLSTPAAITVIKNGVEIHSGQVGQGLPLDTEIDLMEFDWEGAEDNDTTAMTISVTTGVVTVGSCLGQAECDMRKNILINGQEPEQPTSDVGFTPAPDWAGWYFEISAGETITFSMLNHPVGTIL